MTTPATPGTPMMVPSAGAVPPTGLGGRLRQVGPGLIAAATGVGAGDLVATMVAGSRYGTVLLWAAVLGAVLKLALAEGVGRWHLASGSTMLDGWRRLGYWATVFFGVYIVIWGFVYGATAMSAVGLPLNALFGGLSVRYWAMIAGVVGLVLVWVQRYAFFEKFVSILVAIKFVSVVAVAVLVAPNLLDLANGLVPRLPAGSAIYVLGLVGGVGGTITMAAYGYWMIAKGWKGTGWLSVMRLDNAVGHVMTGITRIIRLPHGKRAEVGADRAPGRASATATDTGYEAAVAERSRPFRGYLLWLTLPPMALLFLDRPFALTLVYGVLGAAFMPFLGGTLILLLNSRRVSAEGRSGWLSNLLLTAASAMFVVLLVQDLLSRFS